MGTQGHQSIKTVEKSKFKSLAYIIWDTIPNMLPTMNTEVIFGPNVTRILKVYNYRLEEKSKFKSLAQCLHGILDSNYKHRKPPTQKPPAWANMSLGIKALPT